MCLGLRDIGPGVLYPRKAGNHALKAAIEGGRIVVREPNGTPVKVHYAATIDNWTCYAYVKGGDEEIIIGGWQAGVGRRPTRKTPPKFFDLVESINQGRAYISAEVLPISFGRQPKRR